MTANRDIWKDVFSRFDLTSLDEQIKWREELHEDMGNMFGTKEVVEGRDFLMEEIKQLKRKKKLKEIENDNKPA
jgi:hypothetical protein